MMVVKVRGPLKGARHLGRRIIVAEACEALKED
jgi:hypothetical protein